MSSSFHMQAMYEGEVESQHDITGDTSVTFKLAEIRQFTRDFKNLIRGTVYTGVYKGVISGRVDDAEMLNGKEIVVKAQFSARDGNRRARESRESWKTEVAVLSRFKGDPHIIELIGKCSTSARLFLVFPFFNRGDLAHNISDPDLKSDEALGILEGIAKAINKLHSQDPPLIYRDLKPSNILLRDNFSPVLADFETVAPANVAAGSGTAGYVETDILLYGNADKNSDVFSFGILMLLVLMKTDLVRKGGAVIKQAYQLMEEAKASRGSVMHPSMADKYSEDVETLKYLALRCFGGARGLSLGGMIVEGSLDSRPDMKEILRTIQQMREEIEKQKIADGISTRHQAAHPDEGTSTRHEAAHSDEGTSTRHRAAHPDEGTSTHHRAAHPDEGTSTHHRAAHPDEGTSSRSSDHQITHARTGIAVEPPVQMVMDETAEISVARRSAHEQFGPLFQWLQNAFPCVASCIWPDDY